VSLGQYLLLRIPQCEGLKILDQPLKFDWPNIEARIAEIGGALWGYYSCEQPQADVAAFYKEHTPEPPFNHEEVNWVQRVQGDVGVYYNAASSVWMYVWMVPQPGDPLKTFVIVAESFEPIKGGC
jgi:hypothetical protein